MRMIVVILITRTRQTTRVVTNTTKKNIRMKKPITKFSFHENLLLPVGGPKKNYVQKLF